jgi:hypothetical protein
MRTTLVAALLLAVLAVACSSAPRSDAARLLESADTASDAGGCPYQGGRIPAGQVVNQGCAFCGNGIGRLVPEFDGAECDDGAGHCVSGACFDYIDFSGSPDGPFIDPENDPANCGSPGAQCPSSAPLCVFGACTDPSSDASNCGGPGIFCPTGICDDGVCATQTCAGPQDGSCGRGTCCPASNHGFVCLEYTAGPCPAPLPPGAETCGGSRSLTFNCMLNDDWLDDVQGMCLDTPNGTVCAQEGCATDADCPAGQSCHILYFADDSYCE